METKTQDRQIALFGSGEALAIPAMVQTVLNAKTALMKAAVFFAIAANLTEAQSKGKKLAELKKLVTKEKAKAILDTFNAAKGAFHVWSHKVAALAAADGTMRHNVRVVKGAQGNVIGINTKSRFVKNDPMLTAAHSEIAVLKLQIAEMRAAMQPVIAAQ